MALYSIAPFFAVLAIVYAVFALPFFSFLDPPPQKEKNRLSTLDGLRGLAALLVAIYHAVLTYHFLKADRWEVPAAPFYNELGITAVAFFFMITGYLFWQKLLLSHGAPGWRALYTGRLFRIGPMYLFTIALLVLAIFSQSGFQTQESWRDNLYEIGLWLPLGIVHSPYINGYKYTKLLTAGVTWTLYYEWRFYLSLPLLAFFAREKCHRAFTLAGLALSLATVQLARSGVAPEFIAADEISYLALFFCGMAVASLLHGKPVVKISGMVGSIIALACLALIFVFYSWPLAVGPLLLLAVFFYCLCAGSSLFGFLTLRTAQRLGHISYSIYLLQGLVLAMLFWPRAMRQVLLLHDGYFWLAILAYTLLLSAFSAITYTLIERPGIACGKTLALRFSRKT